MVAVRNKSSHAAVSAVQCLVDLGASMGITDAEGRTALHVAAQRNIPEVIDILIKNGNHVDATDKQGDTAYVVAIKYDSPGALQALIDAGCDRSSIDGLMGTAVGLAAIKVFYSAAHRLFLFVKIYCSAERL